MSKILILLITVVVILGIAFAVALSRRGNARSAQPTRRKQWLDLPLPPAEAFERVKAMAGDRYRLDDADAERKVLVFSSNPTIATWGFLFPVFITAGTNGGSRVEVGVGSRFLQIGPLVTRHHDLFVSALRDQLQVW
ncbi:MAG: hypothetical protein IT385_10565 [Deltaproteobacteria bacterium]|nr:hypothetical protein [Deltaproteobacteria bacterium]